MKFALATLYVEDMDKSLEFYNGILEIPIIRRLPIGQGKEIIFMGIDGQANLELIPSDKKPIYSGFSIGFEIDDIDAVKKKLSTNGYSIKREMSPNSLSTLYFFDGPSGEEVELIKYFPANL